MALQRTRRPRFRSGRSLRSLGSPLNARSLGSPERPRLQWTLAICVLFLVASGYGVSTAEDQAPPPPGTHWKAIPQIKVNLAVPDGWRFRKLRSTSKMLLFEVVPMGPGIPARSQSRYELKVEKRVPRGIVVSKARNYVEAGRFQAVEAEEIEEQTKGVMTLFASVAHFKPDSSGIPQATAALSAIANSRTGTLYTMRFDIPASELEAVQPLANELFRNIEVDDEI
jgi:hypothetical protein